MCTKTIESCQNLDASKMYKLRFLLYTRTFRGRPGDNLLFLRSAAYRTLFYCCKQKVTFGIKNMTGWAGSSYLDLSADGIGLVIYGVILIQL